MQIFRQLVNKTKREKEDSLREEEEEENFHRMIVEGNKSFRKL